MRSWMVGVALFAAFGTSASVASADLPDGITYDDGYAYFYLDNRGSMSNNRPTHEYTFHAYARLLGEGIARESAFKFVLKQGRRTIHTFTCQGSPAYRVRMHPSNQPDMFVVDHCVDRNTRLSAEGDITVEVYLIDDATDEEHLARTHTVQIRRLRQENHQGVERPSHFIVNQHGFSAVALIDQTPRNEQHMYGGSAGYNEVTLSFQRSHGSSPGTLTLRCSVNGERVELPSHQVQSDQISSRRSQASEIRRAGTSTEGDHLLFRADVYTLPLTFGDSTQTQYPKLDDHPGRWECMLRDSQRRTVREFAFTVADGRVQPHPEEAEGLHFPNGVHMVDITIPGDSPVDDRTDRETVRAGAFYGRAWRSSEARAMAQRVPQIGEGFPPSGRARRRGRRR